MPVLVLEGPDGAGKSSLANALVAEACARGYASAVLHFGPPPPAHDPDTQPALAAFDLATWSPMLRSLTDMTSTLRHAADALERVHSLAPDTPDAAKTLLVIDRFHIGPAVYGELYRPHEVVGDGYGELGGQLTREIDRWVDAHGISAYVTANTSTLAARAEQRGDPYLDSVAPGRMQSRVRTMRRIIERYLVATHGLPSFTLTDGTLRAVDLDAISDEELGRAARDLMNDLEDHMDLLASIKRHPAGVLQDYVPAPLPTPTDLDDPQHAHAQEDHL